MLPFSRSCRIASLILASLLGACESSPPPAPPKLEAAKPTPAPKQLNKGQSIVEGYEDVLSPSDFDERKRAATKLFSSSLETTFTLDAHRVHAPQGPLNFTQYQPIYLDVANIDIIDEYKSPMRAPNVEHLLPASPSEAMHIWVKDRLRTTGTDRTLQVIIKDASVLSIPLPVEEDHGWFSKSVPKRSYIARLEVEMRIYSGAALSDASLTIAAMQKNIISEEASPAERKAAFRQLMFDLTDAANAELENQIFKYFTRYISYSQTP